MTENTNDLNWFWDLPPLEVLRVEWNTCSVEKAVKLATYGIRSGRNETAENAAAENAKWQMMGDDWNSWGVFLLLAGDMEKEIQVYYEEALRQQVLDQLNSMP